VVEHQAEPRPHRWVYASQPRYLIKKLAIEHDADEQQQRIKFLSVLVSPPEIATKAVAELQRCSTHLEKANGEPDFEKLVAEIQDLWDLTVTRGSLKLNSKTVDAFALDLACGVCSDDDEETYYVASQRLGLQHEAQCWNCHGFGHTKTECPSPRLFRNINEAAKISELRAKLQQSRTGTGGVAARGRGKGSSSGRGGSSARGSQRQPPGHGNVNSLEDDEDCEDGEQRVYSATGEPLGTMKTAEQFEKPMSGRFALGEFGKTDLGADAFNLNVMALQSEPDDADREFAELPSKSLARSADHVMPPLLAEHSSGDDCESDDEGDDGGDDCGGSDWSNGYSLSPPCMPQQKSATTCNDESQIPENAKPTQIPKNSKPKSLLVGILRMFSSKLQGWAQPSQMLEPVSINLPSGDLPPSPPPSPPAYHDCTRCGVGVAVIKLCMGRFWYESDDSEWHDVCCYRCPTCNRDPLCPLCSPATAPPEPEPEPMPEPEPTRAPGGFPSADELKNDVFKGVPGHGVSSLPPMTDQPGLVPNHWQGRADLEGRAQGWGHRFLPVVHPGAIKLWMSDGAGGHQLIGYGGDRPYRWSEPGSHTPHAVGGQAGFWVRNQQKLDAAAAEEAEWAAAAARVAWRASVNAAAAARVAASVSSASVSSASVPPTVDLIRCSKKV
jgi:hypothetical protein